jgi:VanZ family protein
MKRFASTIAVTLLILTAVLLPGSNIPDIQIVGIDKVAHFTLFFLWSVAIRHDFNPNFKWWLGWIVGGIFSASTEIFQLFVQGRSFDVWDIFFDCLGLSVGLMMGAWSLRIIVNIFKFISNNSIN